MDKLSEAWIAIATAIIGLAMVSVIISRRSQAPQVIQASSSALSNVIAAAVNPVATASTNGNLGANTFVTPQMEDLSPSNFYNSVIGQIPGLTQ